MNDTRRFSINENYGPKTRVAVNDNFVSEISRVDLGIRMLNQKEKHRTERI